LVVTLSRRLPHFLVAVAESSSKAQLKAELQKKLQLLRQEEIALEKLARPVSITRTSTKQSTKAPPQGKGSSKIDKAAAKPPTKIERAVEMKAARDFQKAERALGRATEPVGSTAEPR